MKPLVPFMLAAAATMLASCGGSHLDEAGGAYGVSPDGRWLAEINDAHSKVHGRSFAVIRLWDLGKYPSLRSCGGYRGGKAPTAQLEFPQVFQARDPGCKVSWATNSTEFFVEFESAAATKAVHSLRRFRYDLAADVFSLSSEPTPQ
jgi:hypothetical protein